MNTSSVNQELFELYSNNSLSPREMDMVRAWLCSPMNELIAQHWMRNQWERLASNLIDVGEEKQNMEDIEASLARLHAKLGFS